MLQIMQGDVCLSQISLKCEHKYNELAVVAEPSKALIAMYMPKVPGLNPARGRNTN